MNKFMCVLLILMTAAGCSIFDVSQETYSSYDWARYDESVQKVYDDRVFSFLEASRRFSEVFKPVFAVELALNGGLKVPQNILQPNNAFLQLYSDLMEICKNSIEALDRLAFTDNGKYSRSDLDTIQTNNKKIIEFVDANKAVLLELAKQNSDSLAAHNKAAIQWLESVASGIPNSGNPVPRSGGKLPGIPEISSVKNNVLRGPAKVASSLDNLLKNAINNQPMLTLPEIK